MKAMPIIPNPLIFYSSTVNPATRFVNALIYAVVAGFGAVPNLFRDLTLLLVNW